MTSLCISIVSHGQGRLVARVLDDLEHCGFKEFDVVLTINIPEDESFIAAHSFPLQIIRNPEPKGFGANHNEALRRTGSDLLLVLNPDVRIPAQEWDSFFEQIMLAERVGASSPKVVNPAGAAEDHARPFPTLRRLFLRRIKRHRETSFYPTEVPFEPDWIAGMFMVFKAQAFKEVGGFDSRRYFMYFEDVDICRRLRSRGWSIGVDPRRFVIHDAQRASHRSFRHFIWHATSAARYLTGI